MPPGCYYICDLCLADYDYYDGIPEEDTDIEDPVMVNRIGIFHDNGNHTNTSSARFDVCPDCARAIMDVIKKRRYGY